MIKLLKNSVLVVLFSVVCTLNAQNGMLGTNLAGINDWNNVIQFKNVMYNARPWHTTATNGWPPNNASPDYTIPMDENFYPLQVPYNDNTPITLTLHEVKQEAYPLGTFTLLFEGTGEIEIRKLSGGSFNHTITGNGGETRYEFDINQATIIQNGISTGLTIRIITSSVSDHIKNIRLIIPDENGGTSYTNNYEAHPFNPKFMEDNSFYSVLRFMDFGATNNSTAKDWNKRVLPTRMFQSGSHNIGDPINQTQGASYELMAKLMNETEKDGWICVPHLATDDYVTNMAQVLKDNVNSNLNIYIELSNEIWNGSFSQANDIGYNVNQVSRSITVWNIFKTVFANESNRIITVLSGQAANSGVCGSHHLPQCETQGQFPDKYAIAPYIYGANTTELNNDISQSTGYIPTHKDLCSPHNIDVIAYEGGQHMTSGDIEGVNAQAEMYGVYTNMLNSFKNANLSLFCHFSTTGRWGWYGAWGSKQYTGEDYSTAHKARALRDFANANLDVISPNLKKFSIEIHPNPTKNGLFNLSYSSTYKGKIVVQVFSNEGKRIKKLELQKQDDDFVYQLNLVNQAAGIYLIQVTAGKYKSNSQQVIKG